MKSFIEQQCNGGGKLRNVCSCSSVHQVDRYKQCINTLCKDVFLLASGASTSTFAGILKQTSGQLRFELVRRLTTCKSSLGDVFYFVVGLKMEAKEIFFKKKFPKTLPCDAVVPVAGGPSV